MVEIGIVLPEWSATALTELVTDEKITEAVWIHKRLQSLAISHYKVYIRLLSEGSFKIGDKTIKATDLESFSLPAEVSGGINVVIGPSLYINLERAAGLVKLVNEVSGVVVPWSNLYEFLKLYLIDEIREARVALENKRLSEEA